MTASSDTSKSDGIIRRVAIYIFSVVLLGIGVGGFAFLIMDRQRPLEEPPEDQGRLVTAFPVAAGPHQIAVKAYGTSRAGTTWSAIAEVAGRLVELDEQFEAGEFMQAGTLVGRIDQTDYELAQRRYQAEVNSSEAQLQELGQQETNLNEVLLLTERQLEIAENELERVRQLFEDGQETKTALESSEGAYVRQLSTVQELRNSLALIPAQRGGLQAALELSRISLEEAQIKLSKTDVVLPFTARCASRMVEEDQYVSTGTTLGSFYSIDKAEVVAMFETRKMRELLATKPIRDLPRDFSLFGKIFDKHFAFPADVIWAGTEGVNVAWRGTVARIEASLDQATRSIKVVIEIPRPYEDVIPGVRPPLIPDAFCEVRVYGPVLEDAIVLPRDSVHDSRVYLIRDDRLHIVAIEPVMIEDDLVVVRAAVGEEGLQDGDVVVQADLFPVVEGMKLLAVPVENPAKPRVAIETAAADDSSVTPVSDSEEDDR